ncbi:hypothetical protein [Treponema endosymbiont of Eucomonympha sp.]|uniref:hypothetical protein n=1 Tax=Treponema endosymbiont of Eucomonympha sp. TaxID=1580831 RepID=UPI00139696EE|nr:hypothetical protein [Treponema endosymbiont of Eucomonympha sp.]
MQRGFFIENVFRALKRRRGIVAQSLPLPSLPPFMSDAYFSTFPPRCLEGTQRTPFRRLRKTPVRRLSR